MKPTAQIVLCLLLIGLLAERTSAMPEFLLRIPNGFAYQRMDSGITCNALGHNQCIPGAPRNPFGLDFKENRLKWTKALCEKDSDGDGVTNGEELGDPCCLWSVKNPTTPLRLTMLSHPGDPSEDGAKNAPKCGEGMTAPPTETIPNTMTSATTTVMTTTTVTTTTSTTNSMTTASTTTDATTTTTTELPTLPTPPQMIGSCSTTKDFNTAGCMCVGVIERLVRVEKAKELIKLCVTVFGKKKTISKLEPMCELFMTRNGNIKRKKLLKSFNSMVKKCLPGQIGEIVGRT